MHRAYRHGQYRRLSVGGLGELALGLDRDAGAAFEAAALQDEAARPGGHPLDEPVNALATTLLRLVRSLRHNFGTLRYLETAVKKGLRNGRHLASEGGSMNMLAWLRNSSR
jgi:hypothetical protein